MFATVGNRSITQAGLNVAVRKLLKDGTGSKEKLERKLGELSAQSDTIRVQKLTLTTWNRYLEPGKETGGFKATGRYTSPVQVSGVCLAVIHERESRGMSQKTKVDFNIRRQANGDRCI